MQRRESLQLSGLFRPARTSFGICLLSGALASDIYDRPQKPAPIEAPISAREATSDVKLVAAQEEPPQQAMPLIDGRFPSPRARLVGMVRAEAKIRNLPEDLAEAVAYVESAYDPEARGAVGEVGLMQVLPSTAAMMGFKGAISDLAAPPTNIYYGVGYLAKAWRLSNGDICRALMKYRAGLGEERMTARSVDYCRRAKLYLSQINPAFRPEDAIAARLISSATAEPRAIAPALNVSVGAPLPRKLLIQTQSPKRFKSSASFWVWHDARIRALKQKVHAKWGRILFARNRG